MSIRLKADDATLRASFASLATLDDVARLLEVTPRSLRFYLYKAKRYRHFQIRKKSGGLRTIHSPDNALKVIQQKLNQVLHAAYRGRSSVHGFARHRSILTNAGRHVGCNLLLNFDLADFFPSIHFGRVKGLLQSKPYSLPEESAIVLAQICCHEKTLPAGAPTSPVVANMVCGKMDSQLKELASRFRCKYTRYADDITLSTDLTRFPPAIAYREKESKQWSLGNELLKIITDNGFKINPTKTRCGSPGTRLEVTGLTINRGINVSRKIIRQVRAMLNAWTVYGFDAAQREFSAKYDSKQRRKRPADFRKVLLGKIDFIGFVRGRDDLLFLNLLSAYRKLAPDVPIHPITLTSKAKEEVLRQAVWLLEDEDGNQGTAFAAEGYGLLTAWHVAEYKMAASRPAYNAKIYPARVVRKSIETDLAQLEIDGPIPVQFAIGDSERMVVGDDVTLAGFPNYHVGDSVHVDHGPITQTRTYIGVPHFVIKPTIVKGNSGGPVLNTAKQVVAVAVKGLATPGRFSKFDELSSCVPTVMLKELK